MKTILFFIDSLGSGGAQRQIVQLALGFKERNYKVSFLIYNKAASKFYYEYLRENEIWIDDIDEQNYFRRIIKVRRYIRAFKPDVLISFLEASCFMAELASIPFKKWKLIVGERSANPNIVKTPKLIFYRQFHFIADSVVANSIANLSLIRKISPLTKPSKYNVIYNLLDSKKICPKKEAKDIIKMWKRIYTSFSYEEAITVLEDFKETFKKHPKIVEKVESFMELLEPLFELPIEIRKVIYTSNAVESVNSALRKVTRGKGAFPSEESVYKVLFLRINDLKEKWVKPIHNFKTIQLQLIDLFGERYTKYLNID